MSDEEQPGPLDPMGLDPEAAIRDLRGERPPPPPDPAAAFGEDEAKPFRAPVFEPVIDTRRYQRMIGAFGLAVVVAFSIYLFVHGGKGTPGIPAGQRLHSFVAPLAKSNLNVAANAHPVCNPARPAARGLNVCGRRPIVLAFFALGAKPCIKQVDTLQQVARRFPKVQFAAVAVGAGRAATAKVVRRNHWTIQVGYDESGILGEVYGVEICPLVEVARAGGVVAQRLIGEHWLSAQNLAGVVAKLDS